MCSLLSYNISFVRARTMIANIVMGLKPITMKMLCRSFKCDFLYSRVQSPHFRAKKVSLQKGIL
jgi:hypothetical protein